MTLYVDTSHKCALNALNNAWWRWFSHQILKIETFVRYWSVAVVFNVSVLCLRLTIRTLWRARQVFFLFWWVVQSSTSVYYVDFKWCIKNKYVATRRYLTGFSSVCHLELLHIDCETQNCSNKIQMQRYSPEFSSSFTAFTLESFDARKYFGCDSDILEFCRTSWRKKNPHDEQEAQKLSS